MSVRKCVHLFENIDKNFYISRSTHLPYTTFTAFLVHISVLFDKKNNVQINVKQFYCWCNWQSNILNFFMLRDHKKVLIKIMHNHVATHRTKFSAIICHCDDKFYSKLKLRGEINTHAHKFGMDYRFHSFDTSQPVLGNDRIGISFNSSSRYMVSNDHHKNKWNKFSSFSTTACSLSRVWVTFYCFLLTLFRLFNG